METAVRTSVLVKRTMSHALISVVVGTDVSTPICVLLGADEDDEDEDGAESSQEYATGEEQGEEVEVEDTEL